MPIQSPDEFLQKRLLPEKPKLYILGKYRSELQLMEAYKDHIAAQYREEFDLVMSKVNFLMSACLRKDNEAIDGFISQFGKVENDSFGLDWEKILNER